MISSKRLAGDQISALCSMMAHYLSREAKMLSAPSVSRALPRRPGCWESEVLDGPGHRRMQSAGRTVGLRENCTCK